MKEFRLRPIFLAALSAFFVTACSQAEPPATAESEPAAEPDWVVLFNGENFDGWRIYNKGPVTAPWVVQDGAIVLDVDNAGHERLAGDLITEDQYENFELELEWKISEGGNSGIFWGVREIEGTSDGYVSGLEMQVLDNIRHPDGQSLLTSAGACYGLYPTLPDVVKPVGEYNQVRLIVNNGKVEQWLNGTLITSYDLKSEEWAEKIANSKFADWEHFAKYSKGHIGLQDHTDKVSYRNIRIREL